MARWTKALPKKEGWYLLYYPGHAEYDTQGGFTIWHYHSARTSYGFNGHQLTVDDFCWGLGPSDDAFPKDYFLGWKWYKRLEVSHDKRD